MVPFQRLGGRAIRAAVLFFEEVLVLAQNGRGVGFAREQPLVGVHNEAVIAAVAGDAPGDELGVFPVDQLTDGADVLGGHGIRWRDLL